MIVVKSTCKLGNRAFVKIADGRVTCTLANGVPASLSYAGIKNDMIAETEIRLSRCDSADDALRIIEDARYSHYRHEVFS